MNEGRVFSFARPGIYDTIFIETVSCRTYRSDLQRDQQFCNRFLRVDAPRLAFNPCHYFMTGYSVTVPVMLRRNGLIQVDV